MLLRFIALALLSAPVAAADFRTLNFGDSCADVEGKERALGAVAVPWKQISGADIYAFKIREYDRDLVMTYFCPKGKFFTGNYSYPIEQLDDAVKSYRGAYDWLISTYGAPFLDASPWQVGADSKESGRIASDPKKYMTDWRTARLSITMMIAPNLPAEPPGWRVFIVVGERKK